MAFSALTGPLMATCAGSLEQLEALRLGTQLIGCRQTGIRRGERGRMRSYFEGIFPAACWYGSQEADQCGCVVRLEELQAVCDRFAHGTRGRAAPGGVSRGEIPDDIRVRPGADAMIDVGGDVIGAPALEFLARKLTAMLHPETEVARRMTLRAMAERSGKIGAAIPRRRLRRVCRKALALEKGRVPENHRPALIEREAQRIGPVGL